MTGTSFNDLADLLDDGNWVRRVVELARTAGRAIFEVYQQTDFAVETKGDDSPLTQADILAHRIIESGLVKITPEIPVLSEESEPLDYEVRRKRICYWLVDPLDGTREFIDRNGEFTVNIALIYNGIPLLGVVQVPLEDSVYVGICTRQKQAYRISGTRIDRLSTRALSSERCTIVASRRYAGPVMQSLLMRLERRFERLELVSMGSSLKFCRIAEGKADFYPRLAPTCEWDTAAAQAVVEAAGGYVMGVDFQPLRYNQKQSLLNPHFYVVGDRKQDWQALLSDHVP